MFFVIFVLIGNVVLGQNEPNFITLNTKNGLSSNTINNDGYKNKEIHLALNHYLLKPKGKRYIIPFLLDDCKPPREFNKIHWLKYTDENWLDKLLIAVKNVTMK